MYVGFGCVGSGTRCNESVAMVKERARKRRLNRGFWFLRRRGRRLTSGGGLRGAMAGQWPGLLEGGGGEEEEEEEREASFAMKLAVRRISSNLQWLSSTGGREGKAQIVMRPRSFYSPSS